MKIQPKSESELSSFDLLPDGLYPFTVLESSEQPSKSEKNKGKMLYALKLNVHGPTGDRHVYSYFADWFSEWCLRHFASTVGRLADYEKGDLDGTSNAFSGLTGFVKIGHEDASGNYQAKNTVLDYIVKDGAEPATAKPANDDNIDF